MKQRRASSTTSLSSRLLTILALTAVSALIAGCGSSDKKTAPKSADTASLRATKDAAVAAKVPSDVAKSGLLKIAADASYPPNEFFDTNGKTIIGMDADLGKALAQVMGLKAEIKNAGFDSILPGLLAKKYDIGMSSFTDNKEREKTVDMVTYLTAGTKFYTAADGGTTIGGLSDLCGLTIAVEKGTTQADDGNAQSKKCSDAGKQPVKVDTFPDQNGANLALTSKRAQVGMADSPVAAYIIKQSGGKLKETGTDYGEAPYGIALDKNSPLTSAVLAGVQALIKGGQYAAILKKWNLTDEAIDSPTVNGAVS